MNEEKHKLRNKFTQKNFQTKTERKNSGSTEIVWKACRNVGTRRREKRKLKTESKNPQSIKHHPRNTHKNKQNEKYDSEGKKWRDKMKE